MPELLVTTVVIPLAGAVLIALFGGRDKQRTRNLALLTTLVTLVMAGVLVYGFLDQPTEDGVFASVDRAWIPASAGIDIRFSIALDGIGLWLFALSALLFVTCVLVSWESISDRPASFYSMLLLLEMGCLGVFTARDIILFYIFFEFTLIPLFFLIGIWGSEDRKYAAAKFFIYTLAGSLLTFLGLLSIVLWAASQSGNQLTFSIPELTSQLTAHPMSRVMQLWVFCALFAGFAIKVPLFPLHTWLPLAHVQAPTAGSVILAGILLKIGTYGFVRFSIPMLPQATADCMPWMLWLSVIGIIYGALVALAQSDMKRLIAYSSVSHLGFCMLGLFALNRASTEGAVLQMVNHGISTGALFAIVGMLYERFHTREIRRLGGLARPLPIMAFFMVLFTMSSVGLPGLNGFAGEILILLGTFQRGWAEAPVGYVGQTRCISVLAVSGVVLGAWYMLWLVQRVFFGPLKTPHEQQAPDLNMREIIALTPLAILVFVIGICPQFFLNPIRQPLNQLTQQAAAAVKQDDTWPNAVTSRAEPATTGVAGVERSKPPEKRLLGPNTQQIVRSRLRWGLTLVRPQPPADTMPNPILKPELPPPSRDD